MTALVLRGDARNLPLPDESVDLIVTSPPYWALRSYTDGGEHYDGQIGSEATPAAYIGALLDCTREWVRVLKPSGSLFVNLGDKYAGSDGSPGGQSSSTLVGTTSHTRGTQQRRRPATGAPTKSLVGLPWRYALGCIDQLGLILRAELIWSKPNGLPESVTDRVRRSHENWFHFTRQPKYFAAVDEIREAYRDSSYARNGHQQKTHTHSLIRSSTNYDMTEAMTPNPLGKLPSSVWAIPDDGESLTRSVLGAVAAGAVTIDEGERILWKACDVSWRTSTSPKTAGNGRDGATNAATAKLPTPSPGSGKNGHTASPTDSWSAPSQQVSPSTTPAATPAASDPNISSPLPAQRTSGELTHHANNALSVTPSPTPTSSAADTAPSDDAADRATWSASEHVVTVWTIPSEPLSVPPELGVDHFAAFPTELPKRIIAGWSPSGICTACGEGRRPVTDVERVQLRQRDLPMRARLNGERIHGADKRAGTHVLNRSTITGYVCACAEPTAPTRPAVVLDPFGGTGTVALVAAALGRTGISIDMSADYCRLAQWRTNDPAQRAKVLGVAKPPVQIDGQGDLLADLLGGVA